MDNEEDKKRNGDFRADHSHESGGHLSDDEIIAYQYGNFSSAEFERRAQSHLIECRRCTNALLELNAFTESADFQSNAANTDVQWMRFEQKRRAAANDVALDTPVVEPKPAPPFWEKYFRFPSFNFAGATAFALLAITIGGGIFLAFYRTAQISVVRESAVVTNTPPQRIAGNESLPPEKSVADSDKNALENRSADNSANRRIAKRGSQNSPSPAPIMKPKAASKNADSSPPKIVKTPPFQDELALNRIDVSLYPNEVVRGDAAAELRKIRVRQNSVEQIRLKLNAPKAEAGAAFSIEIVDSQSRTVLTLPVLPDKRGDFYLTIPANKLPAARYALKIYAEKNKSRRVYAEYGFEIASE